MRFALVLTLALFSLLGLAQEEGNPGVDPVAQDEKVLDELSENREARQKSIGKIAEVTEKSAGITQASKIFSSGPLFDSEALAAMEKTFQSANLKSVSPEAVKEQILTTLQGSPLEGFIRSSPKLQDFLVDVMRDEKALLSLIRILKDKDRLKTYLYFWIGIMFAAYYARGLFVSKYWKGPFRALARLVFAATVSVITLSTFGLIFRPELKPLVAIVAKYL